MDPLSLNVPSFRDNISQTRKPPESDITRNNHLRKAADSISPPSLSMDESRMIRREFSNTGHLSYYKANGESQQQMIAGRGQHVDTKI